MAVTEVGTPHAPVTANATNTPSATGIWDASQTRAAGNILICRVQNFGTTTGGTPGTPAGWNAITPVIGSSRAVSAIFWKIASGGDTAPTVSATNAGTAATATFAVYLSEFTGNDQANPIPVSLIASITDTTGNPTATTSGNLPAGAAAVGAWSIVLSVAGTFTTTAGAGWSIEQQDDATSTRGHYVFDHNLSPAAGGTLSETVSHTGTTSFESGCFIVIVPSTAVTPYTAAQPGATWLAHFKPARPGQDRLQILLPGNPVVADTDTAASTESVIGQNATLSDSDTGSGLDANPQLAVSDSDTGSGADAGEKLALASADTGTGADAGESQALTATETATGNDTGTVTGLLQPELLRAMPGPAWLAHFQPGRKHKPVIVLPPPSLNVVAVSDGDTFTDNEGGGFPFTDADASAVPAIDAEQVTVLGLETAAGADAGEIVRVLSADSGLGAEGDPVKVSFTPPQGALFVQPVATGFNPKVGNSLTLTVNAGATTTVGNVVILNCRTFSASHLISVTDSRGNLWRIDSTGSNNGSNINVASAVMGATTFLRPGDTIIVTNSSTSINDGSAAPQAGAVEYSGIATDGTYPVVRLTSVIHTTLSPTTVTTASAGQAGDLVFSAQAAGASSSTFTLTTADPASGGTWTDLGIPRTTGGGADMAAQIALGPSAYSVTWAWTGAGTNGTGVIVLYAGAGVAPSVLPGAETGTGDDEVVQLVVRDSDTSAGAEAPPAQGLADSDTGSAADASTQGPSDSDSFTGLDDSSSNFKTSADTGSGTETLALAGNQLFWRHDTDTILGQDIGISYVSDADTISSGELAFALFADSDLANSAEGADLAGGPFTITDDDAITAVETGGPLRPVTDTDTGSGAEAVGPFPKVSTETAAVTDVEVPAQGVDVWPGIPDSAWRDGRLRVVWHEGAHDEVVLAEGPPSGQLFHFQAKVRGIYKLNLITSSDTGSGADASVPLASVSIAVLATTVSAEIPGTPGPPGMFGYAQGFPKEIS